jgi:hypothetical protein
MNSEIILQLLSNKNTTVTEVLQFLQSAVENFQEEAIERQANSIKQQYKHIDVKSLDLNEQASSIFKDIQKETMIFMQEQHAIITDFILDLINEKKVNKRSAFNFIAILTTVKDLLEEQMTKNQN